MKLDWGANHLRMQKMPAHDPSPIRGPIHYTRAALAQIENLKRLGADGQGGDMNVDTVGAATTPGTPMTSGWGYRPCRRWPARLLGFHILNGMGSIWLALVLPHIYRWRIRTYIPEGLLTLAGLSAVFFMGTAASSCWSLYKFFKSGQLSLCRHRFSWWHYAFVILPGISAYTTLFLTWGALNLLFADAAFARLKSFAAFVGLVHFAAVLAALLWHSLLRPHGAGAEVVHSWTPWDCGEEE